MKSLSNFVSEALNESQTVCGLCPEFDPGKPYQKECEKIFEPIFNKLKDGADKYSNIFPNNSDPEACAAIVKSAMDFMIRNLSNITDDEINLRSWMTDMFDEDDGFVDAIVDGAEQYYDFPGRKEAYHYISCVWDGWDKYCKKVIKMEWF